jgi:hypothetical protein
LFVFFFFLFVSCSHNRRVKLSKNVRRSAHYYCFGFHPIVSAVALADWLTGWIELWVDWETASINASIRKLRNKFRPFSSSLKKWERPSAGWARCCDGDLVFAVGLPMSKKENGPGGRRYRQTDWNRCRTDSFRRTPSTTSKMSTILSTLTRPPSHFPFNSDRLSTPKYPSISDS